MKKGNKSLHDLDGKRHCTSCHRRKYRTCAPTHRPPCKMDSSALDEEHCNTAKKLQSIHTKQGGEIGNFESFWFAVKDIRTLANNIGEYKMKTWNNTPMIRVHMDSKCVLTAANFDFSRVIWFYRKYFYRRCPLKGKPNNGSPESVLAGLFATNGLLHILGTFRPHCCTRNSQDATN